MTFGERSPREFTRIAGSTSSAHASSTLAAAQSPLLTWSDRTLLRGGEPFQIFAGSMHYFRVHPEQWRDRMLRLRDLGLNTVDTYIAWNFHQPTESEAADFTGWRDVDRFLAIADEVGLDAIVRPGPYICAEWSNGGLPAWVTRRNLPLRTSNPSFIDPVRRWFDDLLPRLVPLQAAYGGPIVAVQVENEFGSFGDDPDYVAIMASLLRDAGIVEMLYTADGPTEVMLDGGSTDGVLTALTLGSKATAARELAASRRPDEPFFCAEYWNGWFDHWGQPHHVRGAESAATTLHEIVADGGSVSIYMAHGGTNFGLWAGANRVDGELRATTTSYDSDAPIAEDGRLTEKFDAVRRVLGATSAPLSSQPRYLDQRTILTTHGPDLLDLLGALAGEHHRVPATSTIEQLGVDPALVLYRADVLLPIGGADLVIDGIGDRAIVFVDGQRVGIVEERGSVAVPGAGLSARIELLVENIGRVNYGPRLGEAKGMLMPVLVDRRMIQWWSALPVTLESLTELQLMSIGGQGATGTPALPSVGGGGAHAAFDVVEPLDTHLRLNGYRKGFVWVNGFLLGRYWNIGPQQTLYVPAPLLREGRNDVVILELEERGESIELLGGAELGPTEEYIEEF